MSKLFEKAFADPKMRTNLGILFDAGITPAEMQRELVGLGMEYEDAVAVYREYLEAIIKFADLTNYEEMVVQNRIKARKLLGKDYSPT